MLKVKIQDNLITQTLKDSREPGTYAETIIDSIAREPTIRRMAKNDPLEIKYKASEFHVIFDGIDLGVIKEKIVLISLREAKNSKIELTGKFVSREEKAVRIGIASSKPVFNSDRQEIKPYLKKGAIEEPELEMGEIAQQIE